MAREVAKAIVTTDWLESNTRLIDLLVLGI
jgi:hypothetical protein